MKYRWKDSSLNEKHHPDSDLQSRTTTHKIPGRWVASIICVVHNGVTRNLPEFHPRSWHAWIVQVPAIIRVSCMCLSIYRLRYSYRNTDVQLACYLSLQQLLFFQPIFYLQLTNAVITFKKKTQHVKKPYAYTTYICLSTWCVCVFRTCDEGTSNINFCIFLARWQKNHRQCLNSA